jgi:photosystem II biogenesis protein Psp29
VLLFESLCTSSNFDPKKIKEASKKTLEDYKDKNLKEISVLLKEKSDSNLYSSRILNLGIYLIIANATDFKNIKDSEKNKIISDIINKLNLSFNKAEKDIGIYKSSIIKMKQAKELLEEAKLKEKKENKK